MIQIDLEVFLVPLFNKIIYSKNGEGSNIFADQIRALIKNSL